MMIITILLVLSAWWVVFWWWQTTSSLNARASELEQIRFHDLWLLSANRETRLDIPKRQMISDIYTQYDSVTELTENYEKYFRTLTTPYTSFLQYMYLPRLNIRKDPFTQEIDVNLIWQNFLDNDPYSDLSLIAEWSNYFRDVWSNTQFNEINDIRVDDIEERQWDFFVIPLTLSFTSPDKRSFLMLVEKLSMTSNKENISLINEFFYHLWTVSRERHEAYLLSTPYALSLSETWTWELLDASLWYELWTWTKKDQNSDAITSQDITEAIKRSVSCDSDDVQVCYFLFRDKFRTVPYLAYNIARPWIDNILGLKNFLDLLPPVIEIKQFTFERARDQRWILTAQTAYEWQITLEIYGKGITDIERTEIGMKLWEFCFWQPQELSVESIIQRIDAALVRLSQVDSIDSDRSKELVEMQSIVLAIQERFEKLSRYEKVVKLFELFRMAEDGNVCE